MLLTEVSPEQRLVLQKSLLALAKIPHMRPILQNLPVGLTIEAGSSYGMASYDFQQQKIDIAPDCLRGVAPVLIAALGHELCHANQYKTGLYFCSNAGLSFAEMFRVAKLMEIETRLLSVEIEEALLHTDRYKRCRPSCDLTIYRRLCKKNGFIKGRQRFAKSYWQKDFDGLPQNLADRIDNQYSFYNLQAIQQAWGMYNGATVPEQGNLTAREISAAYVKRMELMMNSDYFLQDGHDGVEVRGTQLKYACSKNEYQVLEPEGAAIRMTLYIKDKPTKAFLIYADHTVSVPLPRQIAAAKSPRSWRSFFQRER